MKKNQRVEYLLFRLWLGMIMTSLRSDDAKRVTKNDMIILAVWLAVMTLVLWLEFRF